MPTSARALLEIGKDGKVHTAYVERSRTTKQIRLLVLLSLCLAIDIVTSFTRDQPKTSLEWVLGLMAMVGLVAGIVLLGRALIRRERW